MPSVSHDNKTLPFKPGQILLAIYHSQTKLNIFCKVINFFLSLLVTEKGEFFQPHTAKNSASPIKSKMNKTYICNN